MLKKLRLAIAVSLAVGCLTLWALTGSQASGVVLLQIPGGGPTWQAEGNLAGAHFGSSVASAGDVNHDGMADLIVGAPDYDVPGGTSTQEGRAFVYMGSATGPGTQPAWTASGTLTRFGVSVSAAGDVNGDGFGDVIVGETGAPGRASVYLGSPSGPSTAPAWVAGNNGSTPNYGASVASAGDVNGDGYDDVIVGAPGLGGPPRAYLYQGSSAGPALTPSWTGSPQPGGLGGATEFGAAVSGAGDVNGDGYDDVLVGEPGLQVVVNFVSCNVGRVSLYFGSPQGLPTTPGWSLIGTADCSRFESARLGCTVSGAGDVNHDGFADFLVGCSKGDRSLLFLGRSAGGPLPTSWSVQGTARGAGDVDGDHYDDVVVGEPGFVNGQSAAVGQAALYLGGSTGLATTSAWSIQGDQVGDQFGAAVAGGDTDGDGLANVLVGAPFYDRGQLDEGMAFLFFGPRTGSCTDVDGDGYCNSGPAADCNDSDPAIHPNATERCNGRDDDCDGLIDEGFGVGGACTSGLGICKVQGVIACAPDGNTFCNAPPQGPPSPETCDGIDNDCDGLVDDGLANPNNCRIFAVTQGSASLGAATAGVGDVNGDGFDDVLVGAPSYGQGRIYLFYGSADGTFRTPDWSMEGTQTPDSPANVTARFGATIAGIGDRNHDGFDDFLVGAPGYKWFQIQSYFGSKGAVYTFYGSPQGPIAGPPSVGSGQVEFTGWGRSVASAGDVDGDGIEDQIIGEFVQLRPILHVFPSASPGFSPSTGGLYGAGMDVNGNGFADILFTGACARGSGVPTPCRGG